MLVGVSIVIIWWRMPIKMHKHEMCRTKFETDRRLKHSRLRESWTNLSICLLYSLHFASWINTTTTLVGLKVQS